MPRGPRPYAQPGTSLYVSNLAWETSWQNLKDVMAEVGPVSFADILRDPSGRSKGCGIVVFQDPESANRAIAELNGREVDGRPIHVREDREQGNPRGPRGPRGPGGPGGFSPRGPPRPGPPPHRTSNFTATFAGEPGSTVYVGGLPYSMRWQGLKDMMRQAGPVEHVEIMYDGFNRSKGCGLVRFATAEDAQNAVRTFNEQTIDGRPLAVRIDAEADKFRQGWSVYVGNLAWEVTWKELKDLMATVGEVIHADVVRDANGYSRGWGTVRFATQEAAQAAIDKFENHELLGRPITVRFDRREHPSLVADEPAADDAQ